MGSKNKEFGILVGKPDGAGCKVGEDACNSKDSVKGCAVDVGILSDSGKPV